MQKDLTVEDTDTLVHPRYLLATSFRYVSDDTDLPTRASCPGYVQRAACPRQLQPQRCQISFTNRFLSPIPTLSDPV